MLFQTFTYAAFFAVIVVLTFLTRGRVQKFVLLLASMFFYAYGSVAQLPLFIFVIALSYALARFLMTHRRKLFLGIGIVLLFTPLFVYKYLPFLCSQFLQETPSWVSTLTLPVGISFYTFQAVGYVIDVYRGNQKAEKDILTFSLFVSFFPQLIAGPIERSKNLLGQIKKESRFEYENVRIGLVTMAYGLFLKVFVADRIATVVDGIYNNVSGSSGVQIALATVLFGFQIYCDFNGYSTIAKGSAKVLGIDLMQNFRRPYLSKSCTEFWQRWHISLSTWFRDYVYIPLGGNRCSKIRNSINLMITFCLSGIWHGANWTYLAWGG